MSHPLDPSVVGIPWCRKEDYDALVAIFVDTHDLPRVWEEFIQIAEEAEKFQKAEGRVVERVYIDPHTFPNWCQMQGYRINAHARRMFAFQVAARRHPGNS